jgi:hypothetical protein
MKGRCKMHFVDWFERLMKKENKLKIGDTVRVKEWDDMVKEYGYYEWGKRIETISETSGLLFTREYEKYCGKCYKIVEILKDEVYDTNELIYVLATDELWPADFCDTQLIKCEEGGTENE